MGVSSFPRTTQSMDIGPIERESASATATVFVELGNAGRYTGDDASLELAHVCLALELMVEAAQARMSEASEALANMNLRMRRAERGQGRATLEILPCGWYWDLDDESRACKADSKEFCEPQHGGHIRAVGMTPARVQMAVDVRASRLAIENGKLDTPDSIPAEFCVVVDGETAGPFFTLLEAVEFGHSTGKPYRAGTVARPDAGGHLRLDDLTESLQRAAIARGWKFDDAYVFQCREGAADILQMAFDAAFQSDQWRIADDALRYRANSREPLPLRSV